ncbi:M28 family metallopeptidase [Parvularcula marina]|uniref:Peptidase M28 n=1 Tax=Parvularcula marina TaxID=2292771 RepID=A0A371R8A9_9PROT|nr:M28 family metallopeptidase [Parvularcula marina]RFB01692.1 peptidase M28 [Parvularcula marina]
MKQMLMMGIGALALAACGGNDKAEDTAAVETETPAAEETVLVDIPAKTPDYELTGTPLPEFPPISEDSLRGWISTLASDEFEGRAPASKGGRMTREYLIDQMQGLGLEPGNKGSYEQAVGLVEMTAIPDQSSFSFALGGETETLDFGDEVVFWSKQVQEDISFEGSDVVFVGFGVNAPEYGWNDYEGLDVTGKTVIILVNDPGFYLEGEEFNGKAMTYYGRWTYKYEEAARQGAAAAIVVHETAPAAYGWGVVEGSWSGPQLDIERSDNGASRVKLEGWITHEVAEELFEAAGTTYADAKQSALSGNFTPTALEGITASGKIKNVINRNESANIAGVLPGTENPDEYIIYTAHWDHLGKTFAAIGGGGGADTINNGAVDNATGTAGLLAIAESFVNAEVQPERSILFLAVTAEESGLLGSAYFGENPFVPLNKIVGGINMDAVMPTGPANDLIVVGLGKSELEDVLSSVAEGYGKVLVPDQNPSAGYFYRSDHFSLSKKGVPMLYADKGQDLVDGGVEAGKAFDEEYTEVRYHKPADEYDESWRMDGLAETFSIMRDVGAELAYGEAWPNWYEGDEFKALRDEMMAGE